MRYKAFISYSHAADGRLAPAVQSGLHRIAKPFYKIRAMRVFRDETTLKLTPKLWPTIQQALRESENFILMASPQAAASRWVRDEIDEWFKREGAADRFFIVLTEGEIVRDHAANDFNWEKSTALPANLRGKFKSEPLHVDFRPVKKSEQLSLRNPEFLQGIGKLASGLYDKEPDEIIGEDVRQHRIFKQVAVGVGALLLALTVATGVAAYIAKQQQAIAEANEAEARRRLVNLYEEQGRRESLSGDPQRALIYLNEAYKEGGNSPSLLFLLAHVSRHFDGQVSSMPGHNAHVSAAHFSRDGRRVVTASDDGTARVWEVATGELVSTLKAEQGQVTRAYVSRDGGRVITVGAALDPDGDISVIKLWDADSGKEIADLRGEISDYVFSGDGRLFLKLWESEPSVIAALDGKELFKLVGHREPISAVAFDRDNARLLTASEEIVALRGGGGEVITSFAPKGKVEQVFFNTGGPRIVTKDGGVLKLWAADTGALIGPLSHQKDPGRASLAVSQDGARIAVLSEGLLKVWDAVTGVELSSSEIGETGAPFEEFDGNLGRLLTVGGSAVGVWEVATGKLLASFDVPGGEISAAAFNPDGEYVFTVGSDNVGRAWALREVKGRPYFELEAAADSAAFSPDGRRLVTRLVKRNKSAAGLFDAASGRRILPSGPAGADALVAISPDARLALSVEGETAVVRDAETGRQTVALGGPQGKVEQAEFSPDGRLLVTFSGGSHLEVWDARTGARLARLALVNEDEDELFLELVDFKFSPDGSRVLATVVESDEGGIMRAEVWNSSTGERLTAAGIHFYGSEFDAFPAISKENKRLVTPNGQTKQSFGTPQVWDITGKTPEPLFELRGHSGGVLSIAFSQDGGRILTGSEDGMAGLWDAQTGSLLKMLSRHGKEVTCAQYDDSRKFVVTGSKDKTVKIWNAETGELLASLEGYAGPVTSVAFVSGGLRLATTSGGKAVRIWDLRLENRPSAELNEKVGRILPYRFYDGRPLPVIERRRAHWP